MKSVVVSITLNGKPRQFDVEANTVLADVLRETCGLTGCKVGCDQAACGVCTVLVNGRPTAACATFMFAVEGAEITTIEGLASSALLQRVQQAFIACRAFQCGFCTPGMILSVAALLSEIANPDEDSIRHWLAGNICRCTGYGPIVAAVRFAAMQPQQEAI